MANGGTFRSYWRSLWQRGFDHLAAMEDQSLAESRDRKSAWDGRTVIVGVTTSVCLSLVWYFGLSDKYRYLATFLHAVGLDAWADEWMAVTSAGDDRAHLCRLLYWVASCVVTYFLIPCFVIKVLLRQRLAEYGWKLGGAFKQWRLYSVLYGLVMIPVVWVSFSESFQRQYPFYRSTSGGLPEGFWIWEAAYILQFLMLEFFFRGFMVHGLKHRFGAYATVAAMIPYCMIHFGKPFPETLGANVAGLVLGVLSLRTGSIVLGFFVHCGVAVGMDLLALWHTGVL